MRRPVETAATHVIEEHENYIDGAWRPAVGERVFELAPAGDRGPPIARFPRSSAKDVADAIDACAASEERWRATAPREREAIVTRAVRELAAAPDPDGEVTQSVGLAPEEIALDREALAAAARDVDGEIERARETNRAAHSTNARARHPPGVAVIHSHWSELWISPLLRVVRALLDGRAVLLLSDPHVPFVAERIVRALEASALLPGTLALVHDDGDTCLRAILDDPRAAPISASGPEARVRAIGRLAKLARAAHEPRGGTSRAPSIDDRSRDSNAHEAETESTPIRAARAAVHFGAGLDAARAPRLELEVLRNRTRVVTRDEDVEAAAEDVVQRAFGRARSLSGRRPGSIARVACHERAFSRFSAALLERLDRDPDVASPLSARERSELDHLRRARELGIDEGATLVFSRERVARHEDRDAEARDARATSARSMPPALSRDRRAEAILWPAVFTNVEEHMRLAWLGRPAPVLCLMRVASDERGAALAEEIDGDPRAEDLSATGESDDDPA